MIKCYTLFVWVLISLKFFKAFSHSNSHIIINASSADEAVHHASLLAKEG
jgi:hypothetical protein